MAHDLGSSNPAKIMEDRHGQLILFSADSCDNDYELSRFNVGALSACN